MMKVTIDVKAYDIGNKIVAKDLQKALALTLTDSAKFANEDFIKKLAEDIDRPSRFTLQKSGYGIVMAKFGAVSDALFSEAYVKPAQSAYLKFIIDGGGVRGLGDAGASKKHAWVPGQRTATPLGSGYTVSPRLSPLGGVPDSYSQKLYDRTHNERGRAVSRATGSGAQGREGVPTYSQGGVFYGTVDGKTGFFARPKRTVQISGAKLLRSQEFNQESYRLGQRDAKGRFIPTGRGAFDTRGRKFRVKADVRVANKGKPVMLLESKPSTNHHQIVDRAAVMAAAHKRSIGMFDERFKRVRAGRLATT